MIRNLSFSAVALLDGNSDYSLIPMSTWVSLVLFFTVLLGAYVWIKRATGTSGGSMFNRNMKLVEKLSLSVDKSIVIFELQGTYYVVYMDKNGAQLLDKRSDLNIDKTIAASSGDFSSVLKRWMDKGEKVEDQNHENED